MRARVLQAELTYTATFARPAYEFVSRSVDLQYAMYRRFAPFGVRANEIRVDNANGQAHEFQASWMNSAMDVIVHYRLGNLEVWTRDPDLVRGDTPRVTEIALAALAATEDIAPELSNQSQSTVFQCHGHLQQSSVSEILGILVQGTDWAQPSGARFALPVDEGVNATLDFLPSAVFPDPQNAWASVTIEWPGSLDARDVSTKTMEFVSEVLGRLDADLDWGN